jgi:hypothetical protein
LLCDTPDQTAVRTAFASDASDRELAKRFGCSHMAVGRHRRRHIVAPLQSAVAALQQLRSVEVGSRLAGLPGFEERLERVASIAEAAGSPTGVAALAGHQRD